MISCLRILNSFKYMRDWQKRLEQTKRDNVFETCAYTIAGGEKKKLKVRTHLRMASLLCILLSGELFCWLLNLEEIYLKRRREEKIRDRFN